MTLILNWFFKVSQHLLFTPLWKINKHKKLRKNVFKILLRESRKQTAKMSMLLCFLMMDYSSENYEVSNFTLKKRLFNIELSFVAKYTLQFLALFMSHEKARKNTNFLREMKKSHLHYAQCWKMTSLTFFIAFLCDKVMVIFYFGLDFFLKKYFC